MQAQLEQSELARQTMQQCMDQGLIREKEPGRYEIATPTGSKTKIIPNVIEEFATAGGGP